MIGLIPTPHSLPINELLAGGGQVNMIGLIPTPHSLPINELLASGGQVNMIGLIPTSVQQHWACCAVGLQSAQSVRIS